MLDSDNLTYKKRAIGSVAAKPAERTLITLERSQKLDLLIHLLANLRQALVVCGPEGIGKTTLLKTLQELRKDQWQICLLQGSSALSFETVITELNRFLNLGGFDLSSLRTYCAKQKVVLIIDDAGDLVPGLIGELVDFADSLSGLRLVFSMTYDAFHIKRASDKAVDDCHFIELPPLSPKQCAEYLQNLSAQPGALVSFNAVTDSLVAALYRETHGIPGKILAEIPKLNRYQSRKRGRLGLWLGIAIVVLATGWVVKDLLPSMPEVDTMNAPQPEKTEQAAADTTITVLPIPKIPAPAISQPESPVPQAIQEAAKPEIAEPPLVQTPTPTPTPQPQPQPQPQEAASKQPEAQVVETQPAPPPEQAPEAPAVATPTPDNQAAEASPPQAAAVEGPKNPPAQQTATPAEEGSDLDWIMAQPANNYTVQIMVLSSKDSVNRFLKKYAEYRNELKYYAIKQSNQEKYVLIFGSFQSPADAKKRKATMPAEISRGVEKKFTSIQKESRR